MKNKQLVLDNLERVRNNIRNLNYLTNTGCSFDELQNAFNLAFENLEKAEGLVSVEQDFYRTNQII